MATTPMLMLTMALAAGPNGLQALHNPATEKAQQEQMVSRLGEAADPAPRRTAGQPDAPPPADDQRAAAWRADHLTCASRKGRTPGQYLSECGAWLAGEAARN